MKVQVLFFAEEIGHVKYYLLRSPALAEKGCGECLKTKKDFDRCADIVIEYVKRRYKRKEYLNLGWTIKNGIGVPPDFEKDKIKAALIKVKTIELPDEVFQDVT
jgi:hypothetical protein